MSTTAFGADKQMTHSAPSLNESAGAAAAAAGRGTARARWDTAGSAAAAGVGALPPEETNVLLHIARSVMSAMERTTSAGEAPSSTSSSEQSSSAIPASRPASTPPPAAALSSRVGRGKGRSRLTTSNLWSSATVPAIASDRSENNSKGSDEDANSDDDDVEA